MTPPLRAACRVERLRLFRFRNYLDESVELGPGLNVVVGRNAQGKTNLLEAVASVALTRSPRAGSAAEVIAWGEPACRVTVAVRRPEGPVELDLKLRRGDTDRVVRNLAVDGKERAARGVLGVCPVVLFWPEDLQLVKGGPDGRRRLLDVVLSQTDARTADDMVRYRRVVEQRNAMLRMVREGGVGYEAVGAFTQQLAQFGGRIRVARARLVAALEPLATAALAELTDGRESLGLTYLGEGVDNITRDDPIAAAHAISSLFVERRSEEIARGVTVAGPHRDDVDILLDGRPARSTASQGQQRSIVLASKLAEVRHVAAIAGVAPVLLLDDVLSELDAGRRLRLLAALGAGAGTQALLTTSETASLDLPAGAEVCRFTVNAGRVSAALDVARAQEAV
jgi:DNA replication and repair protein RecF